MVSHVLATQQSLAPLERWPWASVLSYLWVKSRAAADFAPSVSFLRLRGRATASSPPRSNLQKAVSLGGKESIRQASALPGQSPLSQCLTMAPFVWLCVAGRKGIRTWRKRVGCLGYFPAPLRAATCRGSGHSLLSLPSHNL